MKRKTFLKTSLAFSSLAVFSPFVNAFSIELPNVLIIGDSISIGYTPFVKELLKNKANIYRPMQENGNAENCQGTTYGIQNIQRWLEGKKWDIIHFNFGLHDIKHVDPDSGKNSTNPAHPHQAELKQYKKNLKEIVAILKTTEATLIFATTTPYPDKTSGPLRLPGMPKKYNKAALTIMNKNGIAINNLHDFALPRMQEIQIPENVHFTEEGSRVLAQKVAKSILQFL